MSPKRKPTNKHKVSRSSKTVLQIGIACIAIGVILLCAIFFPVIINELRYRFGTLAQQTTSAPKDIQPIDATFGIVIPKIMANARVIPNVDPYNKAAYQRALTKGVAHAKGSVFPGRTGNVFIFSHSSVDFYEAMRYNSVFYLLDKLNAGDNVFLYMDGNKYRYQVFEKTLVEPTNVSYLMEKTDRKLLTLMTCWPPGTTYKRLIVRAQLQEQ